MTSRKCVRASGMFREDKGNNCFFPFMLAIGPNFDVVELNVVFSLFPLASTGAVDGHMEHSFDEQGMSCLR